MHTIEIDFDGTILWDNTAIDFATLDSYLYNAGLQNTADQPEFHISANRLAKYDTVAKVMADAQRRWRDQDWYRRRHGCVCSIDEGRPRERIMRAA